MRSVRIAAMLAIASGSLAAGRAPTERVVTGDGTVAATINGKPGRLRIDPAVPSMPIIAADWARRAGLKPSFIGIGYAVGPEKVMGESAVARVSAEGEIGKRRVAWLSRPYDASVDGVVGPGGLPDQVIRFVLRGPVPGARVHTFRMVGEGGFPFPDWGERFALVEVGGRPLRIRFDPHHSRTLATAGAGRRLADLFGGRLDGEVTAEEIAFGISRPVRPLALAKPFAFGPFTITRLGVRTADFGNASGIAEANAPPPDPDEVVVTARSGRDPKHDRLSIGADLLARCSSIVFDKPAKAIRLTCA